MRFLNLAAAGALLCCATVSPPIHGKGQEEAQADNRELAEMFERDQEVRRRLMDEITPSEDGGFSLPPELGRELSEGDARRLARTTEMMEKGLLATAQDYYHAAFIFQHGQEPSAYLRAHHAAMVAMNMGHKRASWIAAASLDRYLLAIGQPQIYGTQSGLSDGETSLSEIDAGLITDRERARLDVPPLDAASSRR